MLSFWAPGGPLQVWWLLCGSTPQVPPADLTFSCLCHPPWSFDLSPLHTSSALSAFANSLLLTFPKPIMSRIRLLLILLRPSRFLKLSPWYLHCWSVLATPSLTPLRTTPEDRVAVRPTAPLESASWIAFASFPSASLPSASFSSTPAIGPAQRSGVQPEGIHDGFLGPTELAVSLGMNSTAWGLRPRLLVVLCILRLFFASCPGRSDHRP